MIIFHTEREKNDLYIAERLMSLDQSQTKLWWCKNSQNDVYCFQAQLGSSRKYISKCSLMLADQHVWKLHMCQLKSSVEIRVNINILSDLQHNCDSDAHTFSHNQFMWSVCISYATDLFNMFTYIHIGSTNLQFNCFFIPFSIP